MTTSLAAIQQSRTIFPRRVSLSSGDPSSLPPPALRQAPCSSTPTAGGHSEEHRHLSLLWSQFHEEQAVDEPRLPNAPLREVIFPSNSVSSYTLTYTPLNFARL